MVAARRCPVCQGTLHGPWGEDPAPNRKFCSAACRQTAYRRRAVPAGERRRARTERRTAIDTAADTVEQLLDQVENEIAELRGAIERRATATRAVWRAGEIAGLVDKLATAAIGYDRAAGMTWAELADDAGVDESTLRRRHRQATD